MLSVLSVKSHVFELKTALFVEKRLDKIQLDSGKICSDSIEFDG